jgi:hypothetical protein
MRFRTKCRKGTSRLTLVGAMVLGATMILAGPALAAVTLGSTVSDAAGAFSVTVTIPSNTAAGIYIIAAHCTAKSYPLPNRTLVVDDNTVTPGQAVRVSGIANSCNPVVNVAIDLTLQSLAQAGFSIAQVDIPNDLTAIIQVSTTGVGTGSFFNPFGTFNPLGTGNALGSTLIPVPGPSSSHPIIINNNNSSSSSSSAAAAAGGAAAAAPVTPATLVRTGVDALPLAAAGAAIILLGFILLTAGNRTRPEFGAFAD